MNCLREPGKMTKIIKSEYINDETGISDFDKLHIYDTLYENYINYYHLFIERTDIIELMKYCASYLFDGQLLSNIQAMAIINDYELERVNSV